MIDRLIDELVGWLAHVTALRAHVEAQVGSLGAHDGHKLGSKRLLVSEACNLENLSKPSERSAKIGLPPLQQPHIDGSKTVQEGSKNNIKVVSKLEAVWGPIWSPFGAQLGSNLGPSWLPNRFQIDPESMLDEGYLLGLKNAHLA